MQLPYLSLIGKFGASRIPYGELLQTQEWFEKREKIIKRDDYFCEKCGFSGTVYHEGQHITFDKKKKIDITINGERILADYPSQSDKPIYLHVHHKFYFIDKLPWEYEDDALVTLCNWCHWEIHQNEKIPIYRQVNDKTEELKYVPCNRCNGAGVFPEYKHIENGVCFRCNGMKYEELI